MRVHGGSPFQTTDHIVEDLLFIKEFQPHMVGMGHTYRTMRLRCRQESRDAGTDAIPSCDNPADASGCITARDTALGTIHPRGREAWHPRRGNVVMPNLSPRSTREKYMLYDNKICTGDEAAECRNCLEKRMESIGCRIVVSRGDHRSYAERTA